MEVDSPDDDENHSPCYQRLKLKGKIATVQMRLKTFHDLQATFNTSNPSLMETTSAAAAEQQVKLDALPKLTSPIKVVIKGLPIYTKTQEILSDLEEEGFTVDKVNQLISKKHRGPLPFFLITLPRNATNSKIFDIKTLGYLQVRVEGFLVRGITQCYNCNNFFHTASECRLKPRCLKCGKEHPTKQCPIKERQENPFCINCKEHGHSACYTKCPLFPKPKKGATLPMISKSKVNNCKDGITYANVVSGRDSPSIPTPNASETIQQCECKNSSKGIHGINQDNNSDLAQVIELISIISKILKRSPEILQMLKNLKSAEDDHSKSYLIVEALLNKKDI
ncbi:PRE_C2HC domain-containing protein [Trichonephila clavipes]|nr:PRE_C2HC domain-containing protein [Trichonephila clavipes]